MRRLPALAFLAAAASLTVPAAAASPSSTLVIGEFRTRGPNGANDEFIMLFNKSASPVDASGYKVNRSTSTGVTSTIAVIPASTLIPAGHFYLLVNTGSQGYSGSVPGDLAYTNGIDDNGGIGLLDAMGGYVDGVGMSGGAAYNEGQPLTPETQNVNQSYERKNGGCSPGIDTNNNVQDFNINGDTSSPKNSLTICNPCDGVVCNSPPNTQCWSTAGTCSNGTCSYPQLGAGTPCSDANACTLGDQCDAGGACVSGGVDPCSTPPPNFCVDAMTARQYTSPGTCSMASGCSYPSMDVACQYGCSNGACNPNPCSGVSCTTPPNSCYGAVGTCVGGACQYTPLTGAPCTPTNLCYLAGACDASGTCTPTTLKPIDDMNPCTVDACDPMTGNVSHTDVANGTSCGSDLCANAATCQNGTCVASPVVCSTPPSGGCYAPTGTCNPMNGACTYQPLAASTPCDDMNGCTIGDACDGNGACVGSSKTCTPAAPQCQGDTSVTQVGGVCNPADGSCSFTTVMTTCPSGCNAATGLCNGDPCTGVVCNTPPDACHAAVGTCSNGTCSYAIVAGAACDDGDPCTTNDQCSSAGACAGTALTCNTPPAASCVDASTSRTFSATGTCSGGTCQYASVDTSCAMGCDMATGLCVNDPCAGKNCDQPPTPCSQTIGTCANGVCSYDPKPKGATCDDGDPCTVMDVCGSNGACAGAPKDCNTPPPPACENQSSRSFAATGTCDPTGTCQYASTVTVCPTGCNAMTGLCNSDPCTGVVCNTPPGACYQTNGTCSNGTCTYGTKGAGTPCNDNDPCTMDDVCDGSGTCAGTKTPGCGGMGGAGGSAGAAGSAGTGGGAMGGSAGAGGKAGSGGTGGKGGSGQGGAGHAGAAGAAGHAGAATGGTGGKAGSGGAAGKGGKAGATGKAGSAGAAAGAGGAGEALSPTDALEGGGCGCEIPGGSSGADPRAVFAAFAIGAALLRRRRAA